MAMAGLTRRHGCRCDPDSTVSVEECSASAMAMAGLTRRHGCRCDPDSTVSVEECLLAISEVVVAELKGEEQLKISAAAVNDSDEEYEEGEMGGVDGGEVLDSSLFSDITVSQTTRKKLFSQQTLKKATTSDCVWKRRVGEVRVEKVQRS
ncbi:UNVERIFIED_CONTAM: hypothetical protein FKN15_053622 [Acipenser sinensis]